MNHQIIILTVAIVFGTHLPTLSLGQGHGGHSPENGPHGRPDWEAILNTFEAQLNPTINESSPRFRITVQELKRPKSKAIRYDNSDDAKQKSLFKWLQRCMGPGTCYLAETIYSVREQLQKLTLPKDQIPGPLSEHATLHLKLEELPDGQWAAIYQWEINNTKKKPKTKKIGVRTGKSWQDLHIGEDALLAPLIPKSSFPEHSKSDSKAKQNYQEPTIDPKTGESKPRSPNRKPGF